MPNGSERIAHLWRVRFRDEKDEILRAKAARTLGSLGMSARAALPELVAALEEDAEVIRQSATAALAEMCVDGLDAIPDILRREIKTGGKARTAYALEHVEAKLAEWRSS